ncbi:MAG: AMP-dependent synthetase, partial [Acidimicrobiales bacterium]
WNKPDETTEAFAHGWLHTGDVCREDPDGFLTIVDRTKDMIVSGGFNIFPREVEDVISTHPSVAAVAVIGVPDEKWGETVKALVVLADGAAATEDDLRAWCKERLAGYKCPTSVDFRDELARTATGKLQKFKLREPFWAGRDRQVN